MLQNISKKPLLLRHEIIVVLIIKSIALWLIWLCFFSDSHQVQVNAATIKQHLFKTQQENS